MKFESILIASIFCHKLFEMSPINEITIQNINNLSDTQLTQLLHKLIFIEAEKNALQNWDRHVPLNITTGDAGSDGRISWTGNPKETKWFKNRLTIFQNKATNLVPSKCKEELLEVEEKGQPRKLKSEIENLVIRNGCYILFTTQPLNDSQKRDREKKFRQALKETGHKNCDTFQILIYDANSIKDWVNENIATVTLVQSFNGITRPQGFLTWDEWERKSLSDKNEFQKNTIISENLKLINQTITTENVVRVSGHSGLGKTRLVLESFRNSNLKNQLVYYDLAGRDDVSEIKNYILSHQDHQDGIIVIDNCEIKNHNVLSALVKSIGKLKIITIGLDDSESIEDPKIRIDRNKQRDVVKLIIEKRISETHSPTDIEHIEKLSEGYPWMAIKFCDAVIKQGISQLSNYPLDDFIKKLLFGTRPENEIEYNIIRACAVFSAFGFPDDSFRDVINPELRDSLKKQMEFIRTRVYDGDLTPTKFKETIRKFTNEEFIERKGTFLIVRPTILAINLAANWLLNTDFDKIVNIIKELKTVSLDEKFLERFKDLDQLDKAKEIVAELWGPKSPFGSAEVLNTSWGSQLFRYVVEVNPEITASALQDAFSNQPKEELQKNYEARRNLVWATEKLCFRRVTFAKAAKILYSFAVAENESWANNSTNQFKHLFQIHLSGTEASLQERLDIIRWGLLKNDHDYTRIAIGAMATGLRYDHFSRSGGAEKQGGGPAMTDYVPETWQEIFDYWESITDLLVSLTCMNNENSEIASKVLIDSTRTLIRHGQHNLIIDAIKKIYDCKKDTWFDAVNNLKHTLGFEQNLKPEVIATINSLIEYLTPLDLENQFLLKISKPEWDSYEKDENGHYIDKPKLSAEAFAIELHEKKIDWLPYIKNIVSGEQRQAFNFGKKIAELYSNSESIIMFALRELKRIEKTTQNPEFIAGLLVGTNKPEVQAKFLDNFIYDEEISHHCFYLTRVISPDFKDIEKLFFLVEQKNFAISLFENFKYGRALDRLSKKEVEILCNRISAFGDSGVWTALSLLFMFDLDRKENWDDNKDLIKSLITRKNLLLSSFERDTMDTFYWAESVRKLIDESTTSDFSIEIIKQILEYSSQERFGYLSDTQLANTVDVILKKNFIEVWPYIGKSLLEDSLVFINLKHMLGAHHGWPETEGILFRNESNTDLIIEWSRKNGVKAAKRIANMMPYSKDISGQIEWHPLAKAIIDEFGYDLEVLSELSANMGTFGSIGSVVPYYSSQKILLTKLLHHPIENVRNWAENQIAYLNRVIKKEQLDDEERFLR